MAVRKCPKCGSVWYSALIKCAFCGVDGEEVKGPISPAKLNLGKRGVESGPPPGHSASDRDLASSAVPVATAAPVETAEPKESAEPVKAEAPPPPPPAPEPPKPAEIEPPKVELPPPPPKVEEPVVEKKPDPPPPAPVKIVPEEKPARPERVAPPRPAVKPIELPSAPAPRIPSATVPLVFGVLGLVAAGLLPATWFVQHNKIMTTFAVLAWAILAPFAPFAWLTAQRYADECRTLGFAPAPSAATGRILGMLASFFMIFEFSGLAVFLVVQILSGKVVCPLWK
jgi:hypothetical protein